MCGARNTTERVETRTEPPRRSLEMSWGVAVKPEALFEAITTGDLSRIAFLLQEGVSADEKVLNDTTTALAFATSRGRVKVVALLIKHSANLEAKDEEGLTALLYAARAGQTRVITELLRSGADIHATDNEGATALAMAAIHGHSGAVGELLRLGADAKELSANEAAAVSESVAAHWKP